MAAEDLPTADVPTWRGALCAILRMPISEKDFQIIGLFVTRHSLKQLESISKHPTVRLTIQSDSLVGILTRVVGRFENLKTLGFRYHAENHVLEKDPFLQRCGLLRSKYRLLRTCPKIPNVHNRPRIKKDIDVCALTFSALLKAVVSTRRKLKELHTCRGSHSCVIPENLTLIPSQFEDLLPLVDVLETLHLCTSRFGKPQEDASFKGLLSIIPAAAPNLKNLTLSQGNPEHPLDLHYFSDLAQSVSFTRLEELHLNWIEMTPTAFRVFLRTAAPTLRVLTMTYVTLNEKTIPDRIPHGMSPDAPRLARQMWEFFHDNLSLRHLSIHELGLDGKRIVVRNIFNGLEQHRHPFDNSHAVFHEGRTPISFREWSVIERYAQATGMSFRSV
ncbi:hypothetical protein BO70DRAFT_396413 [Aspergillus heteromorphus CBS 117.55]|uniref:F-box domain-containing protein n=1 Tax=Aspergillus heteromorphus CBS 117.55 TaxID=1448321 RepID=A0A317W9X6_9EURO|nr:uncharacterized protein BO70DRAFT_396413 [Aspergillus heteromorphus CBS 117.55]PWY82117.1 hypothetical protein BO70DRAFT_396413 [Aspergillus heteromorphus CBS 117.55]